jgi:glycosyltransferase involved in cell wall biosynthesis
MNSKNHLTFLYFGINPWDTIKQRPQQLAERLALNDTVIYVNPVRDPLSLSGIVKTRFQIRRISPRLFLIDCPGLLPGSSFVGILGDFQMGLLALELLKFLRNRGIDPNVLWLSHPRQRYALSILSSSMIYCYDCMDDYSRMLQFFWSGNLRAHHIAISERKIISSADVVTATSKVLEDNCRRFSKNVLRVPNGADAAHFAPTSTPGPTVPRSSGRSILGYFGWIGPWIDFDLIVEIAVQRPDWTIRMIGPWGVGNEESAKLRRLRNIELVGEVPYDHLPRYTSGFDVCILPFIADRFAQSVNPVKLYEYLATGKPIVSTDLAEVKMYSDLVGIAENSTEFIKAVEAAFTEKDQTRAASRIQLARANSWDERVRLITEAINNARTKKNLD